MSDEDKELTGSTIKFSELSDEMGALVMTALAQRDRERLLSGQEKYETLDGMISAYEELGKEKGWTRADAESEVVRYLQRRAIAAEGSLDGDGQDNATFGLLAFAIALALYGAATGSGGGGPTARAARGTACARRRGRRRAREPPSSARGDRRGGATRPTSRG